MRLQQFLDTLTHSPESIGFNDTMSVIEAYYNYTPVLFSNGGLVNQPGQNEGSCKIFGFALINGLDKNQTLHCFGEYYRGDVLLNPDADTHPNIRKFMANGWPGIHFQTEPLCLK